MADPANVPNVPGVPPLLFAPGFTQTLSFLTADAIGIFIGVPSPVWGIYKNGVNVIAADTVVGFEFKKEFALSDYPVEDGGFQTFNKVYIPYDARFRFVAGGTLEARTALLASIEAIIGDYETYDVVTPEKIYPSVNLTHYSQVRRPNEGLGMLIVDVWTLQINQTGLVGQSNTQQPGGADQVNGGTVTPTAASQAQSGEVQEALGQAGVG